MVQISRYPTLGRTKVVMQTDVNGQKPDRYVLWCYVAVSTLPQKPASYEFFHMVEVSNHHLNAHWLKTIIKNSANLIFPFTFKGVLNLF